MLGLIYVGLVCNTAGLYFNDMAEDLQVPMSAITLTMSFLNGGGLLGIVLAGRALERFDSRILMSVCAAAVGGGLLLSASFQSVFLFYGVWAIIGFSAPFLMSVAVPTLLGNWFQDRMGSVLGIVYGTAGIGGAVFNTFLGKMIVWLGWRKSLALEGILTLVCLLPFTLFVLKLRPEDEASPGKKAKEQKERSSFSETGYTAKEAYRSRSFYLFVAANVVLTVVSSLIQLIPSHVISQGFAITVGASVMSGAMIGSAAGNVFMGRMLDRFPTERVVTVFTIFGFLGTFQMAFLHNRILLLLSGLFVGLGQAVFQTGLPFCVRKTFGAREYSRIYATLVIPGSVVGTFSAALGGVIYDFTGSYVLLMLLLCGMYVIAGPCLLLGLRRKIREYNKFIGGYMK